MKLKHRVTEYTLYRYRYAIGYGVALIAVIAVLSSAALFVPQGLRQAEKVSSIASSQLQFTEFEPTTVISLPYHLLQLGSITLLGVSELSIKLPSVILGVLAAIGMFMLIRAWARSNVAVITAMIGATIPAFIFASQDGTPMIFSIASSIWLLVAATYVARRAQPRLTWKLLLCSLFVLQLYTPLGIYLCIALLIAAIFHPHIRYVAKRLDPNKLVAASALALILLSPLLYSVVTEPQVGLDLLGVPAAWPDWREQAEVFAATLFGFAGFTDGVARPVISIGLALMMIIGVYRLFKTRHTARSLVTWVWAALLLPFVFFNPDYILAIIPLIVILVAMGIATLIIEWYRIFPLNPYARVFGLLPLSFIVIGIVLSSISRYGAAYTSSPDLAKHFDTDISLLRQVVSRADASDEKPIPVVVGETDREFYQLVDSKTDTIEVVQSIPSEAPYIIIKSTGASLPTDSEPDFIAVTDKQHHSDRIYLYNIDD